MTILTWMKIKIVLFHMASSVTMLAFTTFGCECGGEKSGTGEGELP